MNNFVAVECGGCAPPVVLEETTLTFPRSRILEFYREREKLSDKERQFYRKGQHFYNFMELHKVQGKANREFCDKLFNADSLTAGRMMIARTDWDN